MVSITVGGREYPLALTVQAFSDISDLCPGKDFDRFNEINQLRRYLGIGCSCMSPNPNRMAMLDKLIDEFHVDGVVDIILQACHTYNEETALVGKLVKEKKGIPYTVVETDYSQADVGQIQTRMAAFVEML